MGVAKVIMTSAQRTGRLQRKVVFITGAAQGIGKASALVSWPVSCKCSVTVCSRAVYRNVLVKVLE